MTRVLAVALVGVMMAAGVTGCAGPVVRKHAGLLASNTGRLNYQIEGFTKSRKAIEAARTRLTDVMELSTLKSEQHARRRLAVWQSLKQDASFKQRYELFQSVRKYTDAAAGEDAAFEALATKVVQAGEEAKGQRSEQLTEAAKHLAVLSQEPSLKEKVKFLASFAGSVQKDLKKAEEDADNAEKSASKKVDDQVAKTIKASEAAESAQ